MRMVFIAACLIMSVLSCAAFDVEREINANALNLSACQLKKKEAVDKQRYAELDQLSNELEQEKYVLETMKTGKVSCSCVRKQKKLVKKLDKEVSKVNKHYDKELYHILTLLQKSKLHEINRLERRDAKEADKQLFIHDKNVRIFGVKEECSE